MSRFATALTPAELAEILGSPARVTPALRAIHGEPARDLPARVEGVADGAWRRLLDLFSLPRFRVVSRLASADGTIRLLIEMEGAPIETVVIPGGDRTTVCVSSQSGCSRSCRFCATARLGLRRNLDAGEIVMQVLIACSEALVASLEPPANVVFMGMGEPFD
ncbi:MAG: 23S rRNA (adenine(2503)-C(2))-methyltransferase RlmN, partial [Myxococcota bacterium]